MDVVFAAVGGDDTVARSFSVVKKGGHLISVIDEDPDGKADDHGINFQRTWVQPNACQLSEIATLIDAGTVKVSLDSVFPLADAKAAHLRSQTRRATGKIVLQVSE